MYDKYFSSNAITIGSKIPKHKAILFSGASASTPAISMNLVTSTGNTIGTSIQITESPYFFPMQVFSITSALPAGVTAYYVN